MKLDADHPDFVDSARAWLRTVPDDAMVSFTRVLRSSPGYYPSTIHPLWVEELQERNLAPEPDELPLVEAVNLPVGHPLDYDWRFTPSTRANLIERVAQLTTTGDRVLYFGTPTLFAEAYTLLADRAHLLVDANETMVRTFHHHLGGGSALHVRLGTENPPAGLNAKLLILDPPWYPDDTLHFLRAATEAADVDALIALSQPTPATRPGVSEERAHLLEDAASLGLALIGIEEGALRYTTPHFERMSLGEVLPSTFIPDDWRPGDLLLFAKRGTAISGDASERAQSDSWQEVSFGPVRIKLRASGSADLDEVVPQGRLLNVSRRDPVRQQVGLWTSGNRVRTLVRVEPIARLIRMCETDLRNMMFSHKNTRAHAKELGIEPRVANRLFDLLLLEYQEHVAGGYGVLA